MNGECDSKRIVQRPRVRQPTPAVGNRTMSAMDCLDRLLSAATVCQIIDTKPRTFRRWIADGRFPKPDMRIGRALRWRESTVRAFIEGG